MPHPIAMCGKNAIPLLFRRNTVYNAPDSKLKNKMFNATIGKGRSGKRNDVAKKGNRGGFTK